MATPAVQSRTTRPADPAVPEPAPVTTGRRWWALATAASLVGLASTTTQTVERIHWATNPAAASICDVNASLSCTGVFGHWQSSALGIPNSLIGAAVFALIASGSFAGLTGSRLARPYLAALLGITVFMTGFVTWYLAESAFSMKVLCLYCLGCAVFIIAAGIGLTRAVESAGGLGDGPVGRAVTTLVRSGTDLVLWLGLAGIIATMLVTGLVLL